MEYQKPHLEDMEQLHAEALELNIQSFYEMLEATKDEHEREEFLAVLELAEAVREIGGRALVIGGYVRDEALRRLGWECTPKDMDVEVFGIPMDKLVATLRTRGEVKTYGKAYQILQFKGMDVSIPRTETKIGAAHTEFETIGRPDFSVKDAAARRDLTINALALDPLTGQIIDEVGGLQDLNEGILRAVDKTTFGEDPLRVLRVMQFAGRFNFIVDPETAELCRSLDLSELPIKRIGDEWLKLLEKSAQPSIGMEVARDIGVIEKLHPELHALINCPQDPEWHPEGDVWTHTKMVIDEAAQIVHRESLEGDDAQVILLAALTHDFGKPDTTELNPKSNRYTAYGHEEAGVEPARSFIEASFEVSNSVKERVLPLVKEHMFPAAYPDASDATLRRLAIRLAPASIQELVWVSEADLRGRGVRWNGFTQPDLAARSRELHVNKGPAKRLIEGSQLEALLGIERGILMGTMVNHLYELQLDGKFNDNQSAIAYLKQNGVSIREEMGRRTAEIVHQRAEVKRQRREAIESANAERKRLKQEAHLKRMEAQKQTKGSI
jgi:tRNA nucleotidyltransferase (CCA-adding enzyme)